MNEETNRYTEKLAAMQSAVREWAETARELSSDADGAAEIIAALPRDMQLELFFQLIGPWINTGKISTDWAVCLTEEGKHAAVDVAKLIGPDYHPGLRAFVALVGQLT